MMKKEKGLEILQIQKEKTEKMAKKAIEDYKKFAIKGNVIDMAIGVVIGSAFTNIVNTLVSSIITPVVGMLTNNVDLSELFISLSGGKYNSIAEAKEAGAIVMTYGALLNSILNFFIISLVLFVIFKYISRIRKRNEKGTEEVQKLSTKKCDYCKSVIDIEATRCPHCTSDLMVEEKI